MPKQKTSIKTLGYVIKPQLHGKFKLVAYYADSNRSGMSKKTIHKDLDKSTADTLLYKLEQKLQTD